MTEAQKRAKKKYREKGKRIYVDFYPSEADLLEQINKHSKKQTYIKNLIRADIEESKKLQDVQLSTKDKIAVGLLGAFITDKSQKKGFEEEYKKQAKKRSKKYD